MVFAALKKVFSRFRYIIIAGVVAFAVFVLSVWLPNLKLIRQVVVSPAAEVSDKFSVLAGLLGSIQTNFTGFSAFYTIAIAVLFGVNTAMVAYYIGQRKKFAIQTGMATSFGGLISGLFGVGCAACSTLVLGPLLSLVGAGGVVAFLPFGGREFGVFGVGLLGFSIFVVSKKLQEPLICKV